MKLAYLGIEFLPIFAVVVLDKIGGVFGEDLILLLHEMKNSARVGCDKEIRVLKEGVMNCMWKASS